MAVNVPPLLVILPLICRVPVTINNPPLAIVILLAATEELIVSVLDAPLAITIFSVGAGTDPLLQFPGSFQFELFPPVQVLSSLVTVMV